MSFRQIMALPNKDNMDNNLVVVSSKRDIDVRFKTLRLPVISIIHSYSLSFSNSPFLPKLFGCTS